MSTRRLPCCAVISQALSAAGRPAASRLPCRFHRAHKRADELPVDLRTDAFRIKSRRSQEIPCLLGLVNARWLHVDRFETRPSQLFLVFLLLERPRDTPDPQFHALAYL